MKKCRPTICAITLVALGLSQGAQAQGAATSQPAAEPSARQAGPADRPDTAPGVLELSDGRVLGGWLYTTRHKPFLVYVEETRQWRRIPLLCVLSITAVVVEEKMELEWRWKGMGEPERVYTGRRRPVRRLKWRFRLIDGSGIEGAVKGQPIWVESAGGRSGPYILHERSGAEDMPDSDQSQTTGPSDGRGLEGLIYVKRVIVSRRLMEAVPASGGKTAPAEPAEHKSR